MQDEAGAPRGATRTQRIVRCLAAAGVLALLACGDPGVEPAPRPSRTEPRAAVAPPAPHAQPVEAPPAVEDEAHAATAEEPEAARPDALDALFDPAGPAPPAPLAGLEPGMSFEQARERVPALEGDDVSLQMELADHPGASVEVHAASDEGPARVGTLVLFADGARARAERVWGAPRMVHDGEECLAARWLDPARGWRATIACGNDRQVDFTPYVPLADLLGPGERLGFSPRALVGGAVAAVRAALGDRARDGADRGGMFTIFAHLPPTEAEPHDTMVSISVARDRVLSFSFTVPLRTEGDRAHLDTVVREVFGTPIATDPGTHREAYAGPPCFTVTRQQEFASLVFGSSRWNTRTFEAPPCGQF